MAGGLKSPGQTIGHRGKTPRTWLRGHVRAAMSAVSVPLGHFHLAKGSAKPILSAGMIRGSERSGPGTTACAENRRRRSKAYLRRPHDVR